MKLHPNVKLTIALWSCLTIFAFVAAWLMRSAEHEYFDTDAVTVKEAKAWYPDYARAVAGCPIAISETNCLGVPIGWSVGPVSGDDKHVKAYVEVVDRDDRRLVLNLYGKNKEVQDLLDSLMPMTLQYRDWNTIIVFPLKPAHKDHITIGGIFPVSRFRMKQEGDTQSIIYQNWK